MTGTGQPNVLLHQAFRQFQYPTVPLHTLPDAGQTALAALDKIRRSTARDDHGELEAARKEIEELKSALVSLSLKLHRSG